MSQKIPTQVLDAINKAIYEYCNRDYQVTKEKIRKIEITDIAVLDDEKKVVIVTRHPGMLIGHKGKLVEKLSNLIHSVMQYDLCIEEDVTPTLTGLLVSNMPADWYDDDEFIS